MPVVRTPVNLLMELKEERGNIKHIHGQNQRLTGKVTEVFFQSMPTDPKLMERPFKTTRIDSFQ